MDNIQQLFIASQHNNLNTVQKLLNEGVSVDSQESDGTTALQYAAAYGHSDLVQLLLTYGASVDLPNEYEWTPLMHAACHGHTSTVNVLLNWKAKVNTRNKLGLRPLVVAAWNGHLPIVLLLLEAGAIIDTQISEGSTSECELTSLMASVLQGHDTIVRVLLGRGVSVNQVVVATGITPLMMSACNGHKQIVKLLVESGAYVNATDICNRNAFDIATLLGKTEVTEYLGNKTDIKIFTDVKEVLEVIDAVKSDDVNTLHKLLQDNPPLCNCHLDDGVTPLMYAAMLGHLNTVQLLIKHDAQLDKQDSMTGWTALMHAVFHRKTAIVNYLLDAGADKNIQAHNGCQALDLAYLLQEPDNEVAKLLTKRVDTPVRNVHLSASLSETISFKSSRTSASNRYMSKENQKNISIMNWLGEVSSNIRNRLQTTKSVRQSVPSYSSDESSPVISEVFLSPDGVMENDKPSHLTRLSLSSFPSPGQLSASQKHFPNIVVPPPLSSPLPEIVQGRLCMQRGQRISSHDKVKKNPVSTFHPTHLLKKRHLLLSLCPDISRSSQTDEGHYNQNISKKMEKKWISQEEKSSSSSSCQRLSGSFSDTLCNSTSSRLLESSVHLDKTLIANKNEYTNHERKSIKPFTMESHKEDSIEALLKQLSMGQYINKFKSQEIDMDAFYSLTDEDLQELGVKDDQKRHQLLAIIQHSSVYNVQ